jgi:Zn-dependent alcohol dehydrogenase
MSVARSYDHAIGRKTQRLGDPFGAAADIVESGEVRMLREQNSTGDAPIRAVHELTGGIGVDHAFVCIDPPSTLPPAFRATVRGGNVVVTALTPDTVTEIRIPPLELFVTQKAIMGAVYGFASPRLQIPELLALYRTGDLKLRELITRSYRLDEIDRGYADLEAGKNLRGVVLFDH